MGALERGGPRQRLRIQGRVFLGFDAFEAARLWNLRSSRNEAYGYAIQGFSAENARIGRAFDRTYFDRTCFDPACFDRTCFFREPNRSLYTFVNSAPK